MFSLTLASAQPFLTNGLVAYYPFNGNANDACGHGYNGTVQGATLAVDRFQKTNSCYYFSGNQNWIDLPFGVGVYTGLTFTAWIKHTNYNWYGAIVSARNGDGDLNALSVFENGNIYLDNSSGETRQLVVTRTNTLDGNWHFVAGSIDGITGNSCISIDGISVASVTYAPYQIASMVNFKIGWDTIGAQRFFIGYMDDVRIYNRALSSNELAQVFSYELTASYPIITTDLTNSFAVYGHDATIEVSAASSTNLTYQWYFVPASNAGQAGAYAQMVSGFIYGAVATNSGFGYGNVPHVSFVGGGGSGAAGYATVSNGFVTGITVTNAGYDYSSLPAVIIDPPNGKLFGQTNTFLNISNASENNLGSYCVVLSNDSGSVTSSVVSLTLLYPPSITVNPSGYIASYHSSNSLGVLAAGTPPFSYQWSLNGTNINGATNSNFTINSLNITNTGMYTVQIVNPYGITNSSPAHVYMAPTLTSPFAGTVGLWGQNTTLSVGAAGSGALIYQWYFNGAAISGAHSSSYMLNGIEFTNAGLYSVVVSSAYGAVTNTAYQVVVNPANVSIKICPDVVIEGTPGYSFTIQSTTDLSNTNSWMTETNFILTQPVQNWNDNNTDIRSPNNPQKYYRVVPGQ